MVCFYDVVVDGGVDRNGMPSIGIGHVDLVYKMPLPIFDHVFITHEMAWRNVCL